MKVKNSILKLRKYITNKSLWDSVATVANSPATKIISTIPILGYAILWSDKFSSYLEYERLLTSNGFLSLDQRLYLLYFGAIFILIGISIYYLACPKLIKRNSNLKDFFKASVEDNNRTIVSNILSDSITELKGAKDKIDKQVLLNIDKYEKAFKNDDNNWNTSLIKKISDVNSFERDYFAYLMNIYFMRLIRTNRIWSFTCFISLLIGFLLFIIPSFEVFFLVINKITN